MATPNPQAVADAATAKAQAAADAATAAVCKSIWTANKIKADAEAKAATFLQKLKTALGLLRGRTLLSMLAAETGAVLAAVASVLVSAIMGDVASALSAVMEKIFKYLLLIFQAGPDAAFSLAWLPMKQARRHAQAEATALAQAASNIQTSISIISRWTSGHNTSAFYNQMKSALVPIAAAMDGLFKVLSDLNSGSAAFDEDSYNSAMQNLKIAVDSTIPISRLDEVFGITKRVELARSNRLDDLMIAIKKKRVDDLAACDDQYRSGVASIYNSGPALTSQPLQLNQSQAVSQAQPSTPKQIRVGTDTNTGAGNPGNVPDLGNGIANGIVTASEIAAKTASAEARWYARRQVIELEYDNSVRRARAQAESDANSSIGTIVNESYNNTSVKFAADMRLLKISLVQMLQNLQQAFTEYKACQTFTQNTYYSLDSIKSIIQFFIDIMTSNGMKKGVTALPKTIISAALNVIGKVYDDFSAATGSGVGPVDPAVALNSSTALGSAGMSLLLASGHTRLGMAQMMLNATITQSLIDIVNLDKVLSAELTSFRAFQGRLQKIPDGSGNTGIWAVDPLALLDLGSYLSTITGIVKVTATCLGSISGTESAKKANAASLFQLNSSVSALINHNNMVVSALYSWNPPMNGDCEQLNKTIESASGTVATLLMGLSFMKMIGSINMGVTLDKVYVDTNCAPYWDRFSADYYKENYKGLSDEDKLELRQVLRESAGTGNDVYNSASATTSAYQAKDWNKNISNLYVSTVDSFVPGPKDGRIGVPKQDAGIIDPFQYQK